MKNSIAVIVILVLLISCDLKKQADVALPETDNSVPSMEGTWELVNYYNYAEDEVIDTLPMAEGYRQVKVYADGKIMWTRKVPIDSVEWYGYGTYKNTDQELSETIEYGSASMLKIIDTMRVFSFELQIGDDWFRQINIDGEGNRIISENYVRIEGP